jgi:predicted Ser/Thr protein kinase
VTGKLTVQLGFAPAALVQNHMHAADREPHSGLDLLARLGASGALSQAQVKRVRRYAAMFDAVRFEAVTLRLVERRQPPLSSEDVGEALANLERDTYRRHLGAVLVDLGFLTEEESVAFAEGARESILREDLKVLARYRAQGFSGVARPMIPVSFIHTGVFKVSGLFRSKRTVRFMKVALERLEQDSLTETAVLEFVPPELATGEFAPQDFEAIDPAEARRLSTARWEVPPAAKPEVGFGERTAIGSYHVVEILGQGGMGAVYLGQEEGMGPMVAVKVMLAEKAKADDVARFIREAKICSLLDHKNVVTLLDQGRTEDGLDYMVIPFFVGKDLKAVLDDPSPMDPARAFEITEQVLEGLESIHRKGIVHRDLKPENIFVLAGGGEIKIVDFGIARLLDHEKPAEERLFETKAGVVSGSPAYVAPETITGDPIDARTDIYSLGTMLYVMLTGRLPLFAESALEYLREHLVGVPLTLYQGKKDASWCDEIEQLMASMLAKEPADRPPSCQAILDLLRGGLRERTLAQLANPPEPDAKKGGSLFNTFFKMLG